MQTRDFLPAWQVHHKTNTVQKGGVRWEGWAGRSLALQRVRVAPQRWPARRGYVRGLEVAPEVIENLACLRAIGDERNQPHLPPHRWGKAAGTSCRFVRSTPPIGSAPLRAWLDGGTNSNGSFVASKTDTATAAVRLVLTFVDLAPRNKRRVIGSQTTNTPACPRSLT